jgi:lipoprotein-anchoring transpeptidase ErfK/SrfK
VTGAFAILGLAALGAVAYEQALAFGYRLEPQPRAAAELATRFTPPQLDLLEKLNRRDREHLIRIDPKVPGIVVPEAWDRGELAYSPLPSAWPAAATLPKIVVVDQPSQAFGAYEAGSLVRWGPVSTGRAETPTPAGAFHLTWRSRRRTSTDNDAWILEWYFNFINHRGISFHQFDLPGYAASHACVRLLQRDAEWLYGWGEQWQLDERGREVLRPGTPVLILGVNDAKAPPPWLSLDWLATGVALPETLPFQ